MAELKVVVEYVKSKPDMYGNVYNFVAFTRIEDGAIAKGYISGGVSNVESAMLEMFGNWKNFKVIVSEVGIRELNRLVKGEKYLGCTSEDINPNVLKQWNNQEG
jgi:hypothetical protein